LHGLYEELNLKRGRSRTRGATFFMTTINSSRNKEKVAKTAPHISVNTLLLRDATFAQVNVDEINFSPLNYRKYFSEEALQEFAEELKQHGMISPITIRVATTNGYELVAGERRLRAARMAGMLTVPAAIVSLTDEQVTEIQLAENLQRENPHPMDEAQAIKRMQDNNQTSEEIALRLGKSKKFIYVRLKLINLVEPVREMFYANVLTIQDALEIATISREGQEQFFKEHCAKWKQKNFSIDNLDWCLRRYRYDLKDAPFDTKDKKLLPEIGACTGCSFNSATVKSLFPELAKQAVCTNGQCYQRKCSATFRIDFLNALQTHQPTALIFYNEPSDEMNEMLEQIPVAKELKQFLYREVYLIEEPDAPEKEDYMEDDDDETSFDAEGYETAMEEYQESVEAFEKDKQDSRYQMALMELNGKFRPVLFNPEQVSQNSSSSLSGAVSMTAVQEAIKAGTATPELLEEAVETILKREERAKELDADKVHLEIHRQLETMVSVLENNEKFTDADNVSVRLLVYQSLDFNTRHEIDNLLFADKDETNDNQSESFYKQLQTLTEQQFCYMLRMAIVRKSDSKYNHNNTGYTLYKMAGEVGINIAGIEYEQEEKANARNDRMNVRVKELQKKAAKLKKKTA